LDRFKNIYFQIRDFFYRGKKEDWKIIALCFAGATIFWFFNALNKEYSTRIRYPIEFQFNKDSTILIDNLPDFVRLDVSGGGWNLLRKTFWFDIDPIEVTLDEPTEIRFLTAGYLEPIVAEQINEIIINDLLTDTIAVNIEYKQTKKVPIRVDSSHIKTAPNYSITSPIRIEPDSVLLTGPVSQIRAMRDTFLIPLNNVMVEKDFNEEIQLGVNLPPKVSVDPDVVNISFEVTQYSQISKEFDVETLNFPVDTPWYLKDSSIIITLNAPGDKIEELNKEDFVVMANFNAINWEDSTIIPVVYEYPSYVKNIVTDSITVKVGYGPQ